ncbi:MAG: tRNA preQ1(34) S-adenosylmethionine ribosyltransferase-isomerase QueA [Synechococcales bacterium]|nr:tRNA preQ1(34) S-adenosylmethionine ribosyltransferase-isomerase QueA [Synechococcales bacterium]
MDLDRTLSAYDYPLPPNRIAQNPVNPRDHSKLLVVKDAQSHSHQHFYDLDHLLQPGDLLVLNNTKVIPARLYGHKPTGSQVEVLLLEEQGRNHWLALVKPGKKLPPGATIEFVPHGSEPAAPSLTAQVLDRQVETGGRFLQFQVEGDRSLLEVIEYYGHVPLPPYITDSGSTPEQYQTIYAEHPGSVAAPTAGLHFTPELLDRLTAKGIERTWVTLHVGVGTFRPVEVEDITTHQMHGEWIEVSAETVARIQQTQARGGRIIAVGTTSVRSLEGAAAISGEIQPFCGKTNLFIYPGFQWRVVDGLITNFHLPKSSLMMLVSSLIGRHRLLDLYQEAIAENYRFFSFGDAMLILPPAVQCHE